MDLYIEGDSSKKAIERARVIKNEIKYLMKNIKCAKIVNVGVVSTIMKELNDEGFDVCGTDFDKENSW